MEKSKRLEIKVGLFVVIGLVLSVALMTVWVEDDRCHRLGS